MAMKRLHKLLHLGRPLWKLNEEEEAELKAMKSPADKMLRGKAKGYRTK